MVLKELTRQGTISKVKIINQALHLLAYEIIRSRLTTLFHDKSNFERALIKRLQIILFSVDETFTLTATWAKCDLVDLHNHVFFNIVTSISFTRRTADSLYSLCGRRSVFIRLYCIHWNRGELCCSLSPI